VSPGAPATRQHASIRGYLFVVAAAFCWGVAATLARHLFRDRAVPPLTAVELRLLIAAILLGAWLALRRPESLRIDRGDWGYFVVLGIFGLAAVQGTYFYAISVLGVGLSILIQYVAPSLIVLVDLIRGRRVGTFTIVAVVAALAGTALLVGDVDRRAIQARPYQWLAAAGAMLSFAFFIVYSKQGLRRYPPETVLFHSMCVASVFWAFVTPPWRIVAAGYPGTLWLLFIVLAILSTLVPFAFFYSGLRLLPAARAAVISTVEPVFAIASAAIFLGESLRPMQYIGAVLVLAAAALSSSEPHEGV
jgi:drug/metabolite transporter (DMT)-like permease